MEAIRPSFKLKKNSTKEIQFEVLLISPILSANPQFSGNMPGLNIVPGCHHRLVPKGTECASLATDTGTMPFCPLSTSLHIHPTPDLGASPSPTLLPALGEDSRKGSWS